VIISTGLNALELLGGHGIPRLVIAPLVTHIVKVVVDERLSL
jgi:hypothetical protein